MNVQKVIIQNFKTLRNFEITLNKELNIIVGDNEAGKSTLLEAINLVLTGQLNGRNINYEISPFLFSKSVVDEYLTKLKAGSNPSLPTILIEIYLHNKPEFVKLKGANNSKSEDTYGVYLKIEFNEDYKDEYSKYISDPTNTTTLPTEYYTARLYDFANKLITPRSVELYSTLIDTTTIKLQNGADYYLQRIIEESLDIKERTGLSLAFRNLKESFKEQNSLKAINDKLKTNKGEITNKDLSVSIDISQKSSWENNLTSYIDDIPFQFSGKGEQNFIKMLLALDKNIIKSDVILIEEPENHLSFSTMNALIKKMAEKCKDKQIIITTHSTYVLNKLGLDNLILWGEDKKTMSLKDLKPDTQDYFKKLAGYDTLRLVLSKKSILVEGPSDELIVQKAYYLSKGKLPIEDGIDTISVKGLSFKRFLEIAKLLKKEVSVVTDNDGDYIKKVEKKYEDYIGVSNIKICYDKDDTLRTLEPQLVACNDLESLNKIFKTTLLDKQAMVEFMIDNKTECALSIFNTTETFEFPSYVKQSFQ